MVSNQEQLDSCLKAIADGTRREILDLLRRGVLSVQEIAEEFPMSRPAISKHLRILKESGLVLEQPNGRQRLYVLEDGALQVVGQWLSGFSREGRISLRYRRPVQRDDWRVW